MFFLIGIIGLFLFEIANMYFIMPMPGSQEMNSIDLAYFLYQWRWIFRILFGIMIAVSFVKATRKRRWWLVLPIILVGIVVFMINFKMAADHMFYQPEKKIMLPASANKVDPSRLVLGIKFNGEAKAYPISYLGYHHQVHDSIGGKPVIVTYCTVCRTGRVFEPMVKGKYDNFRLVGMDHFNAMFEDASTKSWWRQVNGEAITGELKGQLLPEVFSIQTSLSSWLRLNPGSLIMQADPAFEKSYDSTAKYETGKSKGKLTRTDSLSWKEKSWVAGVKAGEGRKAYDWTVFKTRRLIHDTIQEVPVLLVLADDDKSFFAFQRPSVDAVFTLNSDTLIYDNRRFRIDGKGIDTSISLQSLPIYQEFWHSWRTFNPGTETFP